MSRDAAALQEAHMSAVYRLLQPKKSSRRAFLKGLIRLFDTRSRAARPSPPELAFVAETLAGFPYEVCEEPLFVIHCILAVWAVQGTLVQTRFSELAGFSSAVDVKDEDDVTEVAVLDRLGGSLAELSEELLATAVEAQSLAIMLRLMNHLQRVFGFTDARCQVFQPSQPIKDNSQKVHTKNVGPLDVSALRATANTPQDVARVYVDLAQLDAADFADEDDALEGGGEAAAGPADDGDPLVEETVTSPVTPAPRKRSRTPNSTSGTKRRPAKRTRGAASGGKAKGAAKKKPKKERRRKKLSDLGTSDESGDDGDDSDFDPRNA
mmetsp:Transcript_1652/g.4255  ORF Transcript_1652/g.4255 Transcript_1652/m.4255 type:complete len:323 (-) Transcript_1652:255-1223(-)